MNRIDYSYDPITLAMPLAKELWKEITRGKIPDGDKAGEILRKLGLKELHREERPSVYANRYLVALVFPGDNGLIVDVIPASGELSDALEVSAYRDAEIGAFVVEIVPANELEYDENIGVEPVILDAESLELKSTPVLGHFVEKEGGFVLMIDRETYERWNEGGKVATCPICGGELAWKGEKAFCRECGYGVEVKD